MEQLADAGSVGLHLVQGGRVGLDVAYGIHELHLGTWVDLSPDEARQLGESLIEYAHEQEEA